MPCELSSDEVAFSGVAREAFARGKQLNTLLYLHIGPFCSLTVLDHQLPILLKKLGHMLRRASESNAAPSKNGQPGPSSPSLPKSSSSRKHKSKGPSQASRSRSSTYVNEDGLDLGPNNGRRSIPPYNGVQVKREAWSPPLTPTQEDAVIKAYASLPSSPRISTARVDLVPPKPTMPTYQSTKQPDVPDTAPPFSLWEYLREELLATDFDSHQELKWERVSNFLSVPIGVEKVCSSLLGVQWISRA